MPVQVEVQTEGEPEYELIEVKGRSSDYVIETFGKPRKVVLDPKSRILRFDEDIHVLVAIRKGEKLFQFGYYNEALDTYQQALDINRYSSLAHYRDRRSLLPAEQLSVGRESVPRVAERRRAGRSGRKCGHTSVWARSSTLPTSGTGR